MNGTVTLNLTVTGTTVTINDGTYSTAQTDRPLSDIVSAAGNILTFAEHFKHLYIRVVDMDEGVFVAFGGCIVTIGNGHAINFLGERIDIDNRYVSLAADGSVVVTILATN